MPHETPSRLKAAPFFDVSSVSKLQSFLNPTLGDSLGINSSAAFTWFLPPPATLTCRLFCLPIITNSLCPGERRKDAWAPKGHGRGQECSFYPATFLPEWANGSATGVTSPPQSMVPASPGLGHSAGWESRLVCAHPPLWSQALQRTGWARAGFRAVRAFKTKESKARGQLNKGISPVCGP